MIVCIPTNGTKGFDEPIGEHFGRVQTYTIVNLDTNEIKIIPNSSHHLGGQGYPPELLKKEGVEVMLCQGLGRRAISMFEEMGIEVYIGARGLVKDAISLYQKGNLQKASIDDACGQHTFRDQHHHEHQSGHCH